MRLPFVLCAALIGAPIADARQKKPEIDAFPRLIGLKEIHHADSRGIEGWIFTGPGKAADVADRLARVLVPRGWTRRGAAFRYPPLGTPPSTTRTRANRPLSLTVLPGRMMASPPRSPLRGEWTTVRVEASHPMLFYSGPGPFPGWKIYR